MRILRVWHVVSKITKGEMPHSPCVYVARSYTHSGHSHQARCMSLVYARLQKIPGEEVLVSNGHTDGATSKVLLVPPEQFSRRLAHDQCPQASGEAKHLEIIKTQVECPQASGEAKNLEVETLHSPCAQRLHMAPAAVDHNDDDDDDDDDEMAAAAAAAAADDDDDDDGDSDGYKIW
eukprot:1162143-Pelagomonas_calceolata.AAC.32